MKVIEKIITYDDYNYVEGTLQFKTYGRKTQNFPHAEYFSIDRISHVHFEVEQKYLAPDLPPGINKNKVSTLPLPGKITTIIDGDYSKPYGIEYDEIIVDDSFVDDFQNITGPRFNSTKMGSELSSTVAIRVYGLIKIKKQRTETENQFEITLISHGPGKIELSPRKGSYATGEKVSVNAIPHEKSTFVGFKNAFKSHSQEFELQIKEEDITIEADFRALLKTEEKIGYSRQIKDTWKNKTIKNTSLGIEAHGLWEILGLFLSVLFYIVILIILIAIFGKGILLVGLIILGFWLLNLISPFIFSWRGFRWISGFILGLFVLGGLFAIIKNFDGNTQGHGEQTENRKPETQEISKENTTVDYKHHLVWSDYDGNEYEIDLMINSDLVNSARAFKNSLPPIRTEASYSNLLSNLYQRSIRDDFEKVKLKLDSIKQAKNINKRHFSDVVVSMVQAIPYFAVVEESCNPYSYRDPLVRDLLLKKPCEPYVRFGIKAPAEFLMDLKGDCDTRTLFLYGLLKSMGYDVAIFGSQKYQHSILGIVLDIERPHYKIQHNKKYFLWEVTEKSYRPGLLPMQIATLDYWNINLN
tara:strand:- start:1839 stop:3590 length:1752 start_codon:yes stop_codon:yes gene_type:complete